MARRLLESHVKEDSYRRSLLISLVGHLALILMVVVGSFLFPPLTLTIGTGAGGGQSGDFISVGLVGELSGGEGMYKPALTPRPTAVPPPPPESPARAVPEAEPPPEDVFVEKAKSRRTPPSESKPQPSPPVPAPSKAARDRETAQPGQIPREPEPGSGGPGGAAGSGAGVGSGSGLEVGPGSGEAGIDSWYVRQVEQRVGQNWLRTTLGPVEKPVRTIISFEVRPNGQIVNIRIEERSGIHSVDLAAERAVRASNPLAPLPYELRHRTVRFVAYFDYPHR